MGELGGVHGGLFHDIELVLMLVDAVSNVQLAWCLLSLHDSDKLTVSEVRRLFELPHLIFLMSALLHDS